MADLFYTEQGHGPSVFLLHGLFGSSTNWRSIAKQLASTYRVINVDLRNHGRSPHTARMTYSDMAQDIAQLIDKLRIGHVALIGHSMGGKAAATLALSDASRVERLVMVDVAPVPYPHHYGELVGALLGLNLDQLRSRSEADRTLANTIPDGPTRQLLLQNLVLEQRRFRWRANLKTIGDYMAEIVGFPSHLMTCQYTGPTLLIRGARSDYVNAQHQPAIAQMLPEARQVTIADAGHWVHADQPEKLIAELCTFLAKSVR